MDPAQIFHLLNDLDFKEHEHMRATIHLHSSKETNWNLAEQLGLSDEAQLMFRHACSEVAVELEVSQTGESKIVAVDGMPLVDMENYRKVAAKLAAVEKMLSDILASLEKR